MPGPPPLSPFGLILRHDGRFVHEGAPIANKKMRLHFERSVEYLVSEKKFIVRLKHFRGEIEVEEAGFFVRSIDLTTGLIALSDGSKETINISTLTVSPIDGALLCRIKSEQVLGGLLARFSHDTQAEFLLAIEPEGEAFTIALGGQRVVCPDFD